MELWYCHVAMNSSSHRCELNSSTSPLPHTSGTPNCRRANARTAASRRTVRAAGEFRPLQPNHHMQVTLVRVFFFFFSESPEPRK